MANEVSHFTKWKWSTRAPLLAPFGNYLGDRRRNDDEDGLLVGRLDQREKLLGALLEDTHRGAILVTGHRGSGKTTLVNHCLREYESALYERFRNRNVAKRPVWDLLLMGALLVLLVGFFGLCSMVLTTLSTEAGSLSSAIPSLLLVAVLLQPLLPAWAAIRSLAYGLNRSRSTKFISFVLFCASGFIAALDFIYITPIPLFPWIAPSVFVGFFLATRALPRTKWPPQGWRLRSFLFLKSIFFFHLAISLVGPASFTPDHPLLTRTQPFLVWLVGCATCILLMALIEFYTVVVHCSAVADRSRLPDSRKAASDDDETTREALHHKLFQERLLYQQTLFFQILRHWIPTLVVNINLGLDALDHRRVIEAMLMQLRAEYQKTFANWRSPVHIFGMLGRLIATLAISWSLASHLFLGNLGEGNLKDFDSGRLPVTATAAAETGSTPIALPTSGPTTVIAIRPANDERHPLCVHEPTIGAPQPPGLTFACWFNAKNLPAFLYTPVVTRTAKIAPLEDLLSWMKNSGDRSDPALIRIRILHLLVFAGIWLVSGRIFARSWPYSKRLRHIDSLLRGLSGKTRQEWIASESPWSRLAGVIFGRDHETYVEADPLDPRTVETAALVFLREIQESSIEVASAARHHLSIPAPEVIFKFDELDKLGVGVLPGEGNPGSEAAPIQGLEVERRRSRALQTLFADLKNLISSGTARFIFIGGRNLHDEWHADLGDRRPLLTHIFTFEVFLPTLLTDIPDKAPKDGKLIDDRNIRHFLHHLYALSCRDLEKAAHSQGVESSRYLDSFLYSQTRKPELDPPPPLIPIYAPDAFGMNDHQAHDFMEDFIAFLSYRSRGNPRRLRMLIESFMKSSRHLEREHYSKMEDPSKSSKSFLEFRDADRVRIQIIAEIYERFSLAIGRRFSFRDDRLVGGALHVSDFLLKFHRRAFGWRNLQRIDELVHVYRSPDLPQVLDLVIRSWTGRYLHRIRNGMYDYRFSAEFSQELQYLSRRNEDEMAALNFTFDEAQELKAIYQARYSQAKDEHSWEFVAALGELHEYDEEYELARFYYFKAMSALDAGFERGVKLSGRSSALLEIVSQTGTGLELLRRWIAWAINRLRVGLQIGMTYERAGDLEQAQARYRVSRTFAASVVRALLNSTKDRKNPEAPLEVLDIPDKGHPDFLSTLKNLNLLFQPAFAEAWVAQKLVGGVDTGVRILERSLWELRWLLPTVKDEYSPTSDRRLNLQNPERQSRELHTNLYLTMGELHNKLGDLLFYKANPFIAAIGEGESFQISHRGGFLGRAHYHYALAVQELRSFICVRGNRSKLLQFGEEDDLKDKRLPAGAPWPAFVYDAISDFLADIGDTLVARASARDILTPTTGEGPPPIFQRESFERDLCEAKTQLKDWLEGNEDKGKNWLQNFQDQIANFEADHLDSVLGKRVSEGAKRPEQAAGPLENRIEKETAKVEADAARAEAEAARVGTKAAKVKAETAKAKAESARAKAEATKAKIGRWEGTNRFLAEGNSQNLLTLKTDLDSKTAVVHHLMFALMSSSFLEEAGQMEDAARKAGRAVEATLTYVEMARCVSALNSEPPRIGHYFPAAWQDWRNHFNGCHERPSRFLLELATLGVAAAERAFALYQQSRHDFMDGKDDFSIGRQIPSQLGIQLCALGLHLSAKFFQDGPMRETSRHLVCRIASLLWTMVGSSHSTDRPIYCLALRRVWTSDKPNADLAKHAFLEMLNEIIQRNSYQVLGRLFALKTRLDHLTLDALEKMDSSAVGGNEKAEELNALATMLEETAEAYDGPLHFTPFYLGVSQALFGLASLWGHIEMKEDFRFDKALRKARETLSTSAGMFTMKKEFYRSIARLFYLYDDFNDRRIHFNHGTQMAGGELTFYLLAILDTEIERVSSDPSSEILK